MVEAKITHFVAPHHRGFLAMLKVSLHFEVPLDQGSLEFRGLLTIKITGLYRMTITITGQYRSEDHKDYRTVQYSTDQRTLKITGQYISDDTTG